MALFEINSQLLNIVLIALGIALVVGVVVVVVFKIINANRANSKQAAACEEAVKAAVEKAFVEIRKEYFVLSRNVTYRVGPEGEIAIGRYLLKSAVSGEDTFNIRHNGLVKPYHDGDVITFGGDDTVCPVSGSVLLKPYVEE